MLDVVVGSLQLLLFGPQKVNTYSIKIKKTVIQVTFDVFSLHFTLFFETSLNRLSFEEWMNPILSNLIARENSKIRSSFIASITKRQEDLRKNGKCRYIKRPFFTTNCSGIPEVTSCHLFV